MRHSPRGRLAAIIVSLLLISVFALGCAGTTTSGQTAATQAPTTQQPANNQTPTTQPSSTTQSTQPPTTTQASTKPVTGSPKGGDPYYPWAGNGGYDVQSYEISLDIDPASGRIAGDAVVTATAVCRTLPPSTSICIGLDVSSVTVDGKTAAFHRRTARSSKIDLSATLRSGEQVRRSAISYSGVPTGLDTTPCAGVAEDGDTIFTLDEPQGAATWFPVNDTPADKATYTFRLTVPKPYTATANGVLVEHRVPGNGPDVHLEDGAAHGQLLGGRRRGAVLPRDLDICPGE